MYKEIIMGIGNNNKNEREIEMEKIVTSYNGQFDIDIDNDNIIINNYSVDNEIYKINEIPYDKLIECAMYLTESQIDTLQMHIGNIVNIETDIIGKYVERMVASYLGGENVIEKKSLDLKFLAENGFV